MIDLKKFGELVTKERNKKKITQNQLATLLYITPQAVSKWERGLSFPDIETLVRICYLFEIPIDYVLNDCFISCDVYNEVTLENIEECMRTQKRKEIIHKTINNEYEGIQLLDIFYLLSNQERLRVVNQVIENSFYINLEEFIVLLSPAERVRLLNGIPGNRLQTIKQNLSPLEINMYMKEELK